MQNDKDTIDREATRILEDWAMCLVEPQEDTETEIFESDQDIYVGTLSFDGPHRGTYKVCCQYSFLSILAQNVLGEDESSDAEKEDALGELANILCGNLLTSLYGSDKVFELTSPKISKVERSRLTSELRGEVASYLADDEPLFCVFDGEASGSA